MVSVLQVIRGVGIAPPVSIKALGQRVHLTAPLSLKDILKGLKPEEQNFHGTIETPAGTALGGWVDMTLRSDGSYTATFHMHDSGIPDYDFTVRAIFVMNNGMTLAAQHSGHVEGTASTGLTHSPRRDDTFSESGISLHIRANWEAVKNGRLVVSKEYSASGLVGFFQDLAKAVLDIAAGATGTTLGVVIGLGAEIGQLFGNLGLGGTIGVLAGVAVIAFGGSVVLAVVVGVAAGAITNAIIKQRALSEQEAAFAAKVFRGSLPPREKIILTNLSGLSGRAFTMPGVDGNIYLNLGEAFNNPLTYTNLSYAKPGQVLIHELTHAWQIAHASFLPGLVCQGIVNQANNQVGENVYEYGPPGPRWSAFNLEQQGAIVDHWFSRGMPEGSDPYFPYIRDNIRQGIA